MTVSDLIIKLKEIVEVHPEADESQVWAYSDEAGFKYQIRTVGWDSRHSPKRVKLCDD